MSKFIRVLSLWFAMCGLMLLSSAAHAGIPSLTMTFTKAFGASSIALNGSTSLTFNVAVSNTGGSTGVFGFTDALPAGLVVATPSGLSAVTCPAVLAGGVITGTAGSGTISIAGLNLNTGQSCTFSVNVTGTTLGVKNNSVTTTGAFIVGGTKTALASVTVAAAVTSPPLIPTLPAFPIVGLMNQPTVLDLSKGSGPSMVTCLMATVRGLLGADAVYLGQAANGVVTISQGGRIVSFYPLSANATSGPPVGIATGGSNPLSVTTSCGSFTIAPALNNPVDFGAVLNASGVSAQFNGHGVMTITVGSTVFVVRPDYFASPGTPGSPSLVLGSDGLYRFTDHLGNVQVLRPAFWDTDGLVSQLDAALGGTTVIQTDGTALFTTITGAQFVMTADYFLSVVTAPNTAKLFWSDAANHYQFRSSILTLSQGLTSLAR